MNLRVDIRGQRGVDATFENLKDVNVDYEAYASDVVRRAQVIVPVRTGRLRRSIGYSVENGLTTIWARTPYAGIVEERRRYMSQAFRQVDLATYTRREIEEKVEDAIDG